MRSTVWAGRTTADPVEGPASDRRPPAHIVWPGPAPTRANASARILHRDLKNYTWRYLQPSMASEGTTLIRDSGSWRPAPARCHLRPAPRYRPDREQRDDQGR